jgi:hypothetical protein
MMARTLAPISTLLAATGHTIAQPCQQHWEAWGGGVAINTLVDWLEPVSTPSGPGLYASGEFIMAGNTSLSRVGLWNGSSWSPLGLGITGSPPMTSIMPNVTSLALFDDGSGPKLFAGGWYYFAGGQIAIGIASWDGAAWTTYNGGLTYSGLPQINLMTVFNDGSGSALYAAGSFTAIAGVPARGIARWNGATWAPVGNVVTAQPSPWVVSMTTFDDGSGPAPYVGGQFPTIGRVIAANMAKWNGTTWVPLRSGPQRLRDLPRRLRRWLRPGALRGRLVHRLRLNHVQSQRGGLHLFHEPVCDGVPPKAGYEYQSSLSVGEISLGGTAVHGHPAAYLFIKQMKSTRLRTGASVEPSQLA